MLVVVKDGKLVNRTKLWPKIKLKQYKKEVVKTGSPHAVNMLYSGNVIMDWDIKGSIILHAGILHHKGKKHASFYNFNLNIDHLRTVFLIPWKAVYSRILFRKYNKFYVRQGDSLVIYKKEENK